MTTSENGRDADSTEIFVFGYYGCGNVGDDLLLAVLLQRLLEVAAKVRVKCLRAPDSSGDPRVTYLELEKILADRDQPAFIRFFLFLWRTWVALRGVRVLIFGGGTLFHANGGEPTNLLILAVVAFLARLRGAKVAAIGVGVGKIRGFWPEVFLSGIQLLSCDFAVRDKSSLNNNFGFGGINRGRLTADLVFLYPLPIWKSVERSRPVLGLALASSAICKSGSADSLAPLSGVLDALEGRGWDVLGLSFQELEFLGFHLSDTELLKSVRNIPIQRVYAVPADISALIGALDVMISMRFHALVLAARLGVPFVGIGRDTKLVNLCQRYGFPFFEVESLDLNRLMSAVEKVRGRLPDRRITEALTLEAAKNFDQIGSLIS